MPEFCKCGSIMFNGSCTNKKCSSESVKVPASKVKKTNQPKTAAVKPASKSNRVVRASKCITYNINDLPLKEE